MRLSNEMHLSNRDALVEYRCTCRLEMHVSVSDHTHLSVSDHMHLSVGDHMHLSVGDHMHLSVVGW